MLHLQCIQTAQSYWLCDDVGCWSCVCPTNQAEVKHPQFNRSWVGRCVWCYDTNFMDKKVSCCTDSIIHQDNQSAMLLEKHGKSSSSKQTRHIHVRYYIADSVAGKEVEVKYCPTSEMLADFFTKPLQGSLFVKFCDLIMNSYIDPDNKKNQDHRSVLEKKESSVCNKKESARGPIKLLVKWEPWWNHCK